MLTDIQGRTAKPKDKPYKLADGMGRYLEVKLNVVKAWRYRFELREGVATKKACLQSASAPLPQRQNVRSGESSTGRVPLYSTTAA